MKSKSDGYESICFNYKSRNKKDLISYLSYRNINSFPRILKLKIIRLKLVFVGPVGSKTRAYKTGYNSYEFH